MNLINGVAFINVIILLIITCIDTILYILNLFLLLRKEKFEMEAIFIFSKINKREIAFDRSTATY